MNICVVGTGYVGLVTGACLAELGNTVWCVDTDENKIDSLKSGIMPTYEPGLKKMVDNNLEKGCLNFTADIKIGLQQALFCFITVGTPSGSKGETDLGYVLRVAQTIGQTLEENLVVVNKSTVTVGTAEKIKKIISEELATRGKGTLEFDVVANPEFLREGAALDDFMYPDRIVLGTDSAKSAELMKQLYAPLLSDNRSLLLMDAKSAEMTKYAANVMLATRISFMNELAQLCDKLGGNVDMVQKGMGTDHRIGMESLFAGIGYGGSCFPKDVKAFIAMGRKKGLEMGIAAAVEKVNERQKYYLVEMIKKRFGANLSKRKFGIWGLAFKPQTDDMREAPSINTIKSLIHLGANIVAFDPVAMNNAQNVFTAYASHIYYVQERMAAVKDVDALVLITEWPEFQQVDFAEMKTDMLQPIIFDGRNQYDYQKLRQLGFEYYCVGKHCYAK